ncbi:MAG: PQQ-binding-like beta-propeller repeat protein [Candidatus Bathyarchaeota archaeon]|nr:PQQ-binding-like beta-propeller repeat protein [Candidatus Bathyarchaeota archaeon]
MYGWKPTSKVNAESNKDNWSMFSHDPARTGYASGVVSTNFAETWTAHSVVPVWSSPAVAKGCVYIKCNNVTCFNATTGQIVWESSTYSMQEHSSIAVVDGYVYSGSNHYSSEIVGDIYALNASTGDKIWSYPTNTAVKSSPAVVDGVVYIGSDDYNVYALNAYTGTKLWNYTTGGEVRTALNVVNGYVYVASNDGNVYAFNSSTGTKIWNYTTGTKEPRVWVSSPTVANGAVYVGSTSNGIFALNASTGAKIWHYPTGDPVSGGEIPSTPAVVDGYVYIGALANVYALNASTGTKIWNFTTNGYEISSPAVANGVVYFGSIDHNVYALDAYNGTKIGNYTTTDKVFSSPAVVGNVVYVGADHKLYAIKISSLKPQHTTTNTTSSQSDLEPSIITAIVATVFVVGLILYRIKIKKHQQHHK